MAAPISPTWRDPPELLEREGELEAIDALLTASAAGVGAALLLEGAAGMGKSALLRDAQAKAAARGHIVLRAAGSPLESTLPFGVAIGLLGAYVHAEGDDRLRGAAALAAPLFQPSTGREDVKDDHVLSLFHGLHWLLAGLGAQAPVLAVVDDAHWADDLSLRFVHYLLQRIDELPVAVLVAARPASQCENALVATLAAHEREQVRRLQPLSEAAVDRLVREAGNGAASNGRGSVTAVTGGNPFYVWELLQSTAFGTTGALGSETVLARLHALPRSARDLAHAIAVVGDGDGATLDDAAALANLDDDAVVDAANRLAHAAILTASSRPAFTHPIVRAAVAGELTPAARSALHARAARRLHARGAGAEQVGAHLIAAERCARPWEVDALVAAAGATRARGDPAAALRHLSAALEGPMAPSQRAVLVADAALLAARVRAPDAASLCHQALDLADGGGRAAVALRLGLALVDGGEHLEAEGVLDRGIAAADDAADDVIAALRASRAAIGGLDGAVRAFGSLDLLLARAAAGAATHNEQLMLAHGGLAAALAGRPAPEARQLVRAALGGRPAAPKRPTHLAVLTLSVSALLVTDDLAEAGAALDAALERAQEDGSVNAFATVAHLRAHVRQRQGRLTDAAADAEAALDAARYGWDMGLPAAHAVLAVACRERGDLEQAARALEVPGGAERWSKTFTWNDLLEARGSLLLATGQPRAALDDLLACGRSLEAVGASHAGVVPWRAAAARAALRVGDRRLAAELAERDLELARELGASRSLGLTLRTAGVVAGGGRGIELLREAVEALAASEGRLEHAGALTDLGEALLAGGHRLAATEPLREALDAADRCGARPLADVAHAALVRAGARPRRPRTSGRDALTPREEQLAGLAAGGQSNREIAEGLFITTKTVETHLARVFTKLAVTSRGELPAALKAPDRADAR